jgi:hypothetical protein
MLAGEDGPFALLTRLAALKSRESAIADRFEKVPKIDYIGTKTKIESLNTQALAEHIDDKFIDFYDNKKNDAMALGKIIREKQRFPVDKFVDIQQAFPCVIAGLRDYAEFIPLERGLFDLVIIDEASQVSIAQALPDVLSELVEPGYSGLSTPFSYGALKRAQSLAAHMEGEASLRLVGVD